MRIKNKMVGIFVTGIHIAITEKKKNYNITINKS